MWVTTSNHQSQFCCQQSQVLAMDFFVPYFQHLDFLLIRHYLIDVFSSDSAGLLQFRMVIRSVPFTRDHNLRYSIWRTTKHRDDYRDGQQVLIYIENNNVKKSSKNCLIQIILSLKRCSLSSLVYSLFNFGIFSFYRCRFDPVNGKEMVRKEYFQFLKDKDSPPFRARV